jgi:hypothetical protein
MFIARNCNVEEGRLLFIECYQRLVNPNLLAINPRSCYMVTTVLRTPADIYITLIILMNLPSSESV